MIEVRKTQKILQLLSRIGKRPGGNSRTLCCVHPDIALNSDVSQKSFDHSILIPALNNLQPMYRHLSKESSIERSALIKEYLCLFNDIPTQSGRAQD